MSSDTYNMNVEQYALTYVTSIQSTWYLSLSIYIYTLYMYNYIHLSLSVSLSLSLSLYIYIYICIIICITHIPSSSIRLNTGASSSAASRRAPSASNSTCNIIGMTIYYR